MWLVGVVKFFEVHGAYGSLNELNGAVRFWGSGYFKAPDSDRWFRDGEVIGFLGLIYSILQLQAFLTYISVLLFTVIQSPFSSFQWIDKWLINFANDYLRFLITKRQK